MYHRSSSLSIWVHPLLHLIQWYLLPLIWKSLFFAIDSRCPFIFFFLLINGLSFVDGSWRPVLSLLTCDADKYIRCFLYTHIVSCPLRYIFITWNDTSSVVVEYTLCLLKCNHYVWQYFYNFQDDYRSSIIGNIIQCGHTCVHHSVHCVIWFFTHHIQSNSKSFQKRLKNIWQTNLISSISFFVWKFTMLINMCSRKIVPLCLL
jgi:hypothetical protein